MSEAGTPDWVAGVADTVIAEASRRGSATVVCASGISPSGPIHLGNLREIMVPHLVAEEVRSRGLACDHVLSWDDYDRLRRVPATVPAGFADYIGYPLSEVPDPFGDGPSWAERFKQPLRDALARLGVEVREVSQSAQYTSGAYTSQVLHAMDARREIDDILAVYRTLPGAEADADEGGADYYPYKIYCPVCRRDSTTIISYAAPIATYTCACGHAGQADLSVEHHGKLVWKVDWPMRWQFEDVTFEAGGVDHSSPGSSYTVGSRLVEKIFGGHPPVYVPYSFVGTKGMAKMSGSAGGAPTPGDALSVLEAPILRWLYTRRRPNQSITVDLGEDIGRIYDEWDALCRRVADGTANPLETKLRREAVQTSTATLPETPHKISFRTLASIVDITNGDDAQLLRILRQAHTADAALERADLEPRLSLARTWVDNYLPAASRTRVLEEPDRALLASLDPDQRDAIDQLLAGLADSWELDKLTTLVYAVPKLRSGLALDAAPTPELKKTQRAFFSLLYRLLVGRETGPRLPTLLLSIGEKRLHELLSA
jgi:lysyl-tRNA synthetase class 1